MHIPPFVSSKDEHQSILSKMCLTILISLLTLGGMLSTFTPVFASMILLCSGSSYSTCTNMGFTDHSYGANNSKSYWGAYPGHNCTNYVAYVETQNSVPAPTYSLGDAYQWWSQANGHVPESTTTPIPGSVAWWDRGGVMGSSGHVAYVESVRGSPGAYTITISEDAYANGPFDWKTISQGDSLWPGGFIYFNNGIASGGTATLRSLPTSDGHIQLFKIVNGGISENWYSPAYGTVGGWTQPVAPPVQATGTPAVTARPNQSVIDVFVRGTNNQIYTTWYDWGHGTWGGWIGMGSGSLSFTSDPQAVVSADGNDQIFGTGGGKVVQTWWNPFGGTQGIWTTSPGLSANAVGSPAIVPRSGQYVIDEFVRGGNNQVYETWYNYQYGTWGGWIGMGGGPLSFQSDPQAVTTPDGHDQVFGTSGAYVEQNWFGIDGSVGGWTTSPALSANTSGSPAVVLRPGQNVVDEFVRGGDNYVYETWYDAASGGWGGWISMGGTTTSAPQAQATTDNHDQVFGTNNSLVQQNWFSRLDGGVGGWNSF